MRHWAYVVTIVEECFKSDFTPLRMQAYDTKTENVHHDNARMRNYKVG